MGAPVRAGAPMDDIGIGMIFGHLKVVDCIVQRGQRTKWRCLCDCGNTVDVVPYNLRSGNSQTCGASMHRQKHGLTGTRVKLIWKYMLGRCYDPRVAGYPNYGGRGIKVCKRWHKLENFFADMGHPPDGKTLERIDNDKDYTPANCTWATRREQMINRRNTLRVTAFGQTKPLIVWAEEYKINGRTLHNRIFRSKIPPEQALTQGLFDPLRKKTGPYSDRSNNRFITAFGKTQTFSAWCREYNVRPGVLRNRIDNLGMAPEAALTTHYGRRQK